MRFAVILAVFSSFWSNFTQVADVNKLQAEAEFAYVLKKYSLSIAKYNELINTYHITDGRVRMNLAHSYYYLHDSVNAGFHYSKLSKSSDAKLNSVSNHQLGIIAASNKEYQSALRFFRAALKADPNNEAARYNYELIKKKLEEKKRNSPPDKDKQKNKSDESEMIENDDSPSGRGKPGSHDENGKSGQSQQSEQDNKGDQQKSKGEGEKNKARDQSVKGDEEQKNNELKPDEKGKSRRDALISQRLKLMNMSEDKARMILEAMKNSEIQYFQQLKKKGNPRYDKDKPTW
jgi:Ca-activated chloride channel homolog